MYTENQERDLRRLAIFESLPTKQAFEYLETCNRHDKLERSIDGNNRGWFQPTEIFKGWLFARFLMIALPIIAILVGLFNKTLIEHGILTQMDITTITNHIALYGAIAVLYKICFKWIYKISSWWIVLICIGLDISGISQLELISIFAYFLVVSGILCVLTLMTRLFSKK